MQKFSVILVDDHQLFREGLKLLLKSFPFINEIHEAGDGKEFLTILKELPNTDLVFMDIDMPVLNGIEATRAALEKHPQLNVIALSMYGEEDYYTRMIDAGARGFILKNSDIKELELAIINITEGKNYFSQEIINGLIRNIIPRKHVQRSSELTEREEEVLYLICKGFSNQEIAEKLFISKRTVDKHRENLLLKTASKNTAGLVIYAIKNQIVEI